MKLGLIAGNRALPLLLAERIRAQDRSVELVVFAFYAETSKKITAYADKVYWLHVGELIKLKNFLAKEKINNCLMAGQISPWRIFNRRYWDSEALRLVKNSGDFRPHTIFSQFIEQLSFQGISFLDSTAYLKEDLADSGVMNSLTLLSKISDDIDFGRDVARGYVELDVGQTVVVKQGSVVCLEALEGTDRAVKRSYKIAKGGCSVLKFSKSNQDMRFDVPVVGACTLRLLRRVKAASLVLEENRVIILDKKSFLRQAREWGLPIVGCTLAKI